jgi:hypothetical protein
MVVTLTKRHWSETNHGKGSMQQAQLENIMKIEKCANLILFLNLFMYTLHLVKFDSCKEGNVHCAI